MLNDGLLNDGWNWNSKEQTGDTVLNKIEMPELHMIWTEVYARKLETDVSKFCLYGFIALVFKVGYNRLDGFLSWTGVGGATIA